MELHRGQEGDAFYVRELVVGLVCLADLSTQTQSPGTIIMRKGSLPQQSISLPLRTWAHGEALV